MYEAVSQELGLTEGVKFTCYQTTHKLSLMNLLENDKYAHTISMILRRIFFLGKIMFSDVKDAT